MTKERDISWWDAILLSLTFTIPFVALIVGLILGSISQLPMPFVWVFPIGFVALSMIPTGIIYNYLNDRFVAIYNKEAKK